MIERVQNFAVANWQPFLVQVLAGVIVAGLVYLFINKFTYLLSRPKPRIVVRHYPYSKPEGFSQKIYARLNHKGDYEFRFRIGIENKGRRGLKADEGYWHLFFPFPVRHSNPVKHKVYPTPDDYFHDKIRETAIASTILNVHEFEFHGMVKASDTRKHKAYYYFSTDYGFYPRKARVDIKSGRNPKPGHMYSIPIETVNKSKK